jgi:hypothetical protein
MVLEVNLVGMHIDLVSSSNVIVTIFPLRPSEGKPVPMIVTGCDPKGLSG